MSIEYLVDFSVAQEGEKRQKHKRQKVKFSQRSESQHQEKTLLLRGAALASLFTIHKIQVLLSNSVQAFHINVCIRQTTRFLPLLLRLWFPNL